MQDKPLKNMSILLVEDNEMNTLLASAILQRIGAKITEADNGMEAVNLLKKRSFDLVLMDLHLPVMNGFETTRYIRHTLNMDVPVIAITANVVNGEEAKCLEAGMDAFISKPYTEKNLVEKIQYCVAKKNSIKGVPDNDRADAAPALYNLKTIEDICSGNRKMVNEMLKAFIKQVPHTIEDIKSAYNKKDFSAIYAAAHNIKPNIDTLQIESLKDNIRQIEHFANQQKNGLELSGLIEILDTVLSTIVEQLKTKEFV
jgi:CheY-like chemotaxis protein/HPt (histidine-containing phosphotransfer) domain-containing protein